MATQTKTKQRKHVATRISPEAYQRLEKRVKRAKEPTNLGAIVRAIIEEHA